MCFSLSQSPNNSSPSSGPTGQLLAGFPWDRLNCSASNIFQLSLEYYCPPVQISSTICCQGWATTCWTSRTLQPRRQLTTAMHRGRESGRWLPWYTSSSSYLFKYIVAPHKCEVTSNLQVTSPPGLHQAPGLSLGAGIGSSFPKLMQNLVAAPVSAADERREGQQPGSYPHQVGGSGRGGYNSWVGSFFERKISFIVR